MGSISWGTGTDTFGVDYLDAQVPNSGSSEWQSSDINAHMLSALELKRMSGHFDAGVDTTTGASTPADTPLSLKQEGASTGYYRTIHYSSHNADNYFFSQNILMYDRHIITNVSDIQRLVWKPTITEDTFNNASMVDGTTSNIKCYSISQFEASKVDILKKGKTDEYTATNINIVPAIISPDSPNHLQGFNYWGRVDERATWVDRVVYRYNQTYGSNSNNVARYCPVFGNHSPIILPNSSGEISKWAIDDTGNYAARFVYKAADQYSYLWTTYCNVKYWVCSEDELLHVLARSGMKFVYKNTMYKPVAENGVITGYTDDMDKKSDWDNWHDYNDHEVPITPPAPGPSPGYDDDPWNGATFAGTGVGGAGAFAKCYYMTSTELANLRSWMNSNNVPEGFDPMQQIIGLSQVPVSLSGDDNTTVQFVNSSAVYDPGVTRLVDSGVSTQISMGTPKRYSLGSVDITRRMQERGEPYLDYDCQIELYLPLIGMFSLDTQAVMGRTITAEAILDPISGTLAAYAYVTRDGQNLPIAYGSTTIGVDLPISAQQYSVSRAALKQANAQLGTSLLSSTLSFIAAATAGGKGSGTGAKTATGSTNGLAAAGIREAGADYMKASQVGNVFGDFMNWGRTIRQLSYGNNTAIAGSFGGSTAQWSYPFTPYVKIIRPRYEKPSNYNHSQGVPCVQAKKVGDCTGFIQCIGVEVKGITGATDIELQAIQAALTNGVFAGGGS